MSFCRAQNLFTTSQDVSSFQFLRIDNSTQPISTRPELHQACGVARRVKGVTTSRLFFLCEFGRHWGKAWKDRFPDPSISNPPPPQNSENPISKGWEWEWKKKIIRQPTTSKCPYIFKNFRFANMWANQAGSDFWTTSIPAKRISRWQDGLRLWDLIFLSSSLFLPFKMSPGLIIKVDEGVLHDDVVLRIRQNSLSRASWTLVNTNQEIKRNSSSCWFLCLSLVFGIGFALGIIGWSTRDSGRVSTSQHIRLPTSFPSLPSVIAAEGNSEQSSCRNSSYG